MEATAEGAVNSNEVKMSADNSLLFLYRCAIMILRYTLYSLYKEYIVSGKH
jgi:hypothetical protein